jgi:hypothetical protein
MQVIILKIGKFSRRLYELKYFAHIFLAYTDSALAFTAAFMYDARTMDILDTVNHRFLSGFTRVAVQFIDNLQRLQGHCNQNAPRLIY